MKRQTITLKGMLAGTVIAGFAILATPTLAQDRNDAHGGKARGGQSQGARPQTRPAQASAPQTRVTQAKAPQARAPQATAARTRTTSTRTMASSARRAGGRTSTGGGQANSRALRMSSGPTGRGITASDWRGAHPSWNGGYYYHNGGYYYDSAYSSPAIVVNEWAGIAVGFGGITVAASLSSDPTLYFSGAYGSLYSFHQYQIDLNSPDARIRLRAAYFGKPYFWRDGARYDRSTVVNGGVSYYRFTRR